ncbi:flagellar motor switch protein FliG [Spirochaetia bacterium]|nr:flagellar motor switch protein FliG [Spirochaetia bacterium]
MAGGKISYPVNMDKPQVPGALRGVAAYQQTLQKKGSEADPSAAPEPAGLVKTLKSPQAAQSGLGKIPAKTPGGIPQTIKREAGDGTEDSKYRRVAKFLILIGGDEASRILSHLEGEQVEAISREIASIRGITAEEGEAILEEFKSLLASSYAYSGSTAGGVEAARRLLYAAFGPEKGEALLNKSVPDSRENPFGFLEDFSGDQVVLLLKEEAPSTAALILSRLPPKFSAAVLARTTGERKLEIVRRIARMDQVAPEVIERVASALKEKARHIGAAGAAVDMDGMSALAEILKAGDYSFGDRLLNELENEDPALGRTLKERLYTLDDVITAEDKPLQDKLRTMSDHDIALLLKGKASDFVEKLLSNVSAQRRGLIREEGEIMGAVPRKEVDEASQNFLAWFRLNREAGNILLLSDEDLVQ